MTGSIRAASVCLVVVAFAVLPGWAQDTEDWKRVESEHFLLVGNASESAIRRVAEQLEEFRSGILAVMPSYASADEKDTTIVVFRHDVAFEPFKPLDGNGEPEDFAGFFWSRPYRNTIALTGDAERAIFEGYAYEFTTRSPTWPDWMQVGAAAFYSSLDVRSGGRTVYVGQIIPYYQEFLFRAFIPLEVLLDPNSSFEEDLFGPTIFRAETWAFFHFMQFGPGRLAPRLNEFNRLMASSDNDIRSSVQAAFGMNLETLESEFLDYIRNSITWPAAEVTPDDGIEDADIPRASNIEEWEASFYLGELLYQQGRDQEAATYLARALEGSPQFEPVLTTLYLLNDRLGNPGLASEYLERAVQVPDSRYLPHLLYAQKLLREDSSAIAAREAETHLRRVVSLRPSLAEGHLWLGQALMRRPETIEDALVPLQTAIELSPGNPPMQLTYVRALLVAGDDLRASGLLMALAQTAADPVIRDQVAQLQEQIVRMRALRDQNSTPRD